MKKLKISRMIKENENKTAKIALSYYLSEPAVGNCLRTNTCHGDVPRYRIVNGKDDR